MRLRTRTKIPGAVFIVVTAVLSSVAVLMPVQVAVSEEKADAPPLQASERKLIEIYRIAPGKHEAFLRDIAAFDKANEMAGLPPRQLFVHSDGASWDFMLIQPASTPADKSKALSEAWDALDLPSGVRFFLTFRENITEHSDTFAYGPTNAADVLSSIEE